MTAVSSLRNAPSPSWCFLLPAATRSTYVAQLAFAAVVDASAAYKTSLRRRRLQRSLP